MDSEEAPPPYSAVDPLLDQPTPSNGGNVDLDSRRLTLRGGNAPLPDAVSRADSTSSVGDSTSVSSALPANFLSAAAYFAERPPSVVDDGRAILVHDLTIYPRSQSKDFPRRPRCWSSRNNEITQQDWDTFLRYLFPPQLGLASTSGHLPRQLRAEIQRDRKDRPQETDEQREKRIRFVIAEWNQYFFIPRGTRIVFVYVIDPERAPSSSLCPRCYPAATRSSQDSRPSPVPGPGHWHNPRPNLPSTLGGQHAVPPAHSPFPNGAYVYPPAPMTLPFPPYGMPPIPPAAPPTPSQPRVQPPMPPVPPNYCHWGWNNGAYSPQSFSYSSSKSGPLGWISQLASQAQKYGERITEQAEHYGRQMEEQAMAHGRWIEEQTGFGGQKVERFGDAISNLVVGRRDQWTGYGGCQPAYPLTPISHTSPPPVTNRAIEALPQTPSPIQTQIQTQTQSQPPRPRRSSTASTSSESSLTSIDSISTTSDLSPSDLATVRAQLLSLDDHHDRNLYDAAVGLRRHLDVLQESRRQARFPGQGYWRNGWWYNHPHNHGYGRGEWGRWESPQQQQQNRAERQAIKEEMRATKKAFRDVFRRAREEQREQRRLKRSRRRQERKSRKQRRDEQAIPETPLEQRLQNLELENRAKSRSDAQPATSRARSQSTSSAACSEISIISTPSTTSSEDSANSRNDQDGVAKDEKKQAKIQPKNTEPQPKKEKDNDPGNKASSTGF